MKQLTPLVLREKYYRGVEEEVQRLFDILIYRPLTATLMKNRQDIKLNSMCALVAAVANGIIWYEDGQFKGKFSSNTTKELRELGARWNPDAKTFSLNKDDIPVDIRFAQVDADQRYNKLRHDLIKTLDDMDISVIDSDSKTANKYAQSVNQMEMDFRKSVSAIQAISVPATLTIGMRAQISEQWGGNLDLYIKGWAAPNILKLRQDIMQPILAGGRAESLVKMLQQNYQVSKNKAKFLARQETALLMSKFQETRYGDMGITNYRWSTSHDERVRHDHALLNGKTFSFQQPPVSNRKTGARNNPGEDFNCRCIAIPLIV